MQYEFGAYTLDGARFELRRGGAVIPVQRRVLDTILCLIEHRGRVVTKDELVSGPWQGATVTDAALNRAVMLARRALQQKRADPPCIQTVRGRGFRWTAPVRVSGSKAPASAASDLDGPEPNGEAEGSARVMEPPALADTDARTGNLAPTAEQLANSKYGSAAWTKRR